MGLDATETDHPSIYILKSAPYIIPGVLVGSAL